MKKADFYYAILQECRINSVDATGAIFYCAIMPSTKFRNCILRDANFICSNIKYVVFDEDCDLEGAVFDGAIGLDLAKVNAVFNAGFIGVAPHLYLLLLFLFRQNIESVSASIASSLHHMGSDQIRIVL